MKLGLLNTLTDGRGGGISGDGLALDLQFAADKTLTARKGPTPVFTRASSATFVGSNGLIQSAATNIPRFDHTSAGVCRGLLIEESRTNLSWPSAYTAADLGFGIFPAGSTTMTFNQLSSIGPSSNGAVLMLETATTQVHGGYAGTIRAINPTGIAIVSGTVYTASIYVKASGRTRCRLSFNTGSNIDGIFAAFNLSGDGSITTNSTTYGSGASAAGLSASITKNADGWFRLTVSGSLTNTTGFITVETLDDSGNRSYLGDATKGLLITNGQLEAGSFATSYIPTTIGSVVRSADVCSITGGDFNTVYNESEHTLFVQASAMSHANFGSYLSFDNSTPNEQSAISGFPSPNRGVCYVVDGGTTQTNPELSITLNQSNKIAAGMKLNSFQVAINNATGTQDASGTMPTANTLKIGRAWNSATISGTYAQVKVFKKRLPNAKLAQLTV